MVPAYGMKNGHATGKLFFFLFAELFPVFRLLLCWNRLCSSFLKYGEDKLIGEGVQAIRDEDAEAYIRQKVGVHVDPVIAQYDDPDDCERKEEILERCFFAFNSICQHGKGQHDRSVFEGKEPLYPVAEAPLDNLTLIVLLRQEARDNEGYIAVDTRPRGTCIQGEVPNPPT